MARTLDGAAYAKSALSVITVGLALIITLVTSGEISASERSVNNRQVQSISLGEQKAGSAFSQQLVVEAQINIRTTSELRLAGEMGLPCDGFGSCHLEMTHHELMILQEAQIPVNVTARALKMTLDDSPNLVTESDTYQYASRYDNLVIDDWDEASYNVSISDAPSWAVVTDVRYSARIVHSYPGELWLQLAWNEPDVLVQIWPALGGADDGGNDDDPEFDDDIELLDRRLWSDFDGLSVNATWGILAEDFTISGNSGWFDYFELYIYYVLNDDFDHAFEINSLPYFNSQDYSGATKAADDPDASCDDVGGTIWYRYTAPQDELVRFQIGGRGGEWIAIFTGARGNLSEVACDRGSGTDGWWSRVDLSATAGTTYHILIGPDDSDEGYLEIEAYRLESNCDTIGDIPRSECLALKAFYEQMSDAGDIESTWFKSDTACSWYGVTCNAGHVTELNLLLSHLNGKIVPELEDLTRLRVLELGRNEYWSGGIPPELGNLTHLEVLDLGSSYLLDGPIPPELGNLSNLVILNLEQNDLTGGVPSELGNLSNLREFYLDWTFLSGNLPQSLTNLDLFVFRFHDTDLCEPGDAVFQNWLQGIDDLTRTGVTCSIAAPTLFDISNSAGDGSYMVSWSNISTADSYQLQEQHDGGSWTTIYSNSGTSVNRTGRSDGEWCYRVRASNAGGVSDWSNVECTTVDATPPEAPNLLSPENGSTTRDSTPTFDWTTPSSATQYRLQVDSDASFPDPDINVTTSSSIYTPNSALSDGTTYWRVQARDAAGNWSTWSDVWSVTVSSTMGCQSEEDTDGDGLLDGWEACGYDDDGDGNIDVDLPAMGADPEHKDIFVEIDYMAGDHSHRPSDWAIQTIVDSFDRAPVTNPDQSTGIHLHVDYGPDAPLAWADGTWGTLSQSNELIHTEFLGYCSDGSMLDNFYAIKAANFSETRHSIFHYNTWIHYMCADTGLYSGFSLGIPASDFIVSLGDAIGVESYQAGTFMHELGHNLGLYHGGNENVNHKPNYLSVMNYSFQMNGLIRKVDSELFDDGYYDYSHSDIFLDERALDEEAGLPSFPEDDLYGTKWNCEVEDRWVMTPLNSGANTDIDWNCINGIERGLTIATDINRSGGRSTLTGHNDWANLVYHGGAVGGPGIGEEPSVEIVIDELTLEEAETIPSIENLYLPFVTR